MTGRDEHGKTIHQPVTGMPSSLDPGDPDSSGFYGAADPADTRQPGETPLQWQARAQTRYMTAMREVLRGVELTGYERDQLEWLAGWDGVEVVVLSLLDRMYRQGVEDERAHRPTVTQTPSCHVEADHER